MQKPIFQAQTADLSPQDYIKQLLEQDSVNKRKALFKELKTLKEKVWQGKPLPDATSVQLINE